MPGRTTAKQLEGTELAAWKGLLRAHRELTTALDETLEREHGLPLTHYEVLFNLGDAGPAGLRMSALADELLLSRSGLTRLVDRLVERGWVVRERCSGDARGYLARLTPAGRRKLNRVRPTHLADVRARFHDRLSHPELEKLAEIWNRLGGED